jgi:hypothetical protein
MRKYPIAAESYKESFHGKVVKYGNEKAANCLDCHASAVNYYMSVHELLPSRNPKSPVSAENRVKTCKKCHVMADKTMQHRPASHQKKAVRSHYADLIYPCGDGYWRCWWGWPI